MLGFCFFFYIQIFNAEFYSACLIRCLKDKGIECSKILLATISPESTEVRNHRLKTQKFWALSISIAFSGILLNCSKANVL